MSYPIYVSEETARGDKTMDIMSRLLQDRIIFIGQEINDPLANHIISQLIYLRATDPKKPISLYINSPGGDISAGFAIYDTMKYIECDVHTYCIGMAASMAAVLLSSGTPGKRFALPNSRIMIHQPAGAVGGTSADIELQAKEIMYLKESLTKILSQNTGQTVSQIHKDSDRDYYMSSSEAKNYGLIDAVIGMEKSTPAAVSK
jgi:ATP-dependent Clp protease protease subunit